MLNWSDKVRLNKVFFNMSCHNVLIFSRGPLKISSVPRLLESIEYVRLVIMDWSKAKSNFLLLPTLYL